MINEKYMCGVRLKEEIKFSPQGSRLTVAN